MNKTTGILIGIVVLGLLGWVGFWSFEGGSPKEGACPLDMKICPDGTGVERSGPLCEFAACPNVPAGDDMVRLTEPAADAVLRSPLTIRGEARGSWYFEASFPVRLFDGNGKELGAVPAQALGDWMTTEFVPFEATLVFTAPDTETGTLVLEKDNPSGLPENADELRVPVRFAPSGQ